MPAKKKQYVLRLGYLEIGTGTLPQVQAAQRAIEALRIVRHRSIETGPEGHRMVLVEAEDGRDSTEVAKLSEPVMTREEFERERMLKIEGPVT